MSGDKNIQTLLGDYMAPTADDGFADAMMAKLDAEAARQKRYRRLAINGAGFIGGIIAAVQLPKLGRLVEGFAAGAGEAAPRLSGFDLPSFGMSVSTNVTLGIAAFMIAAALWIAMDQRAADML